MDDFMKSLQGLSATDLSALGVTVPASRQEEVGEKIGKIARRRGKRTAPTSHVPQLRADNIKPESTVAKSAAPVTADLPDLTTAKPTVNATSTALPTSPPNQAPPTASASSTSPTHGTPEIPDEKAPAIAMPPPGPRQRLTHEWPAVGAVLQADYFGTVYHVEVVPAKKLLKSGKQLKLLDGPARGKRFDSFSRAMLAATAHQRKTMRLDRRGMSSGWTFWKAGTTSIAPAPKASSSPTSKPAQ